MTEILAGPTDQTGSRPLTPEGVEACRVWIQNERHALKDRLNDPDTWRDCADAVLAVAPLLIAEVERLRGMLAEALDEWEDCGTWAESTGNAKWARIAEIRREAGQQTDRPDRSLTSGYPPKSGGPTDHPTVNELLEESRRWQTVVAAARSMLVESEAERDQAESEVRRLNTALAQAHECRAEECLAAESNRAEAARLRGLLAEVTPYAIAGAEALDHWEPYGDAEGDEHTRLCETARDMLARLRPGGDIHREAGLT